MKKFKSFEDLECWKEGRNLRIFIKDHIIPKLPNFEKYELTSQIRRSSRSICSNISEGHGRYHYQENIQFCRMARGSLTDTLNHGINAFDDGYNTEKDLDSLRNVTDKELKILNGYIKYL